MATKPRKSVKKGKASKVKAEKPLSKGSNIENPMNRSELFNALAEAAELTRTQVKNLYGSLEDIIARHFKKNGPQQFVLPGLAKITLKSKPAVKARKGTNPFTGEEMMFKAKPARNVVKIKPLKTLKSMA